MFGDERRGETWPRGEMTAFDGSEKSRWFRAEGAGMEKRCQVLFGLDIPDGTIGEMLRLGV